MGVTSKILGAFGSAGLTLIGHKQTNEQPNKNKQTDRQSKYI